MAGAVIDFDAAVVEIADDVCALSLVRRVSALLDLDATTINSGDVMPRGWHFILFPELSPRRRLPHDGYPLPLSGIDPSTSKVMLGGRRARFQGDIRVGATLRRERRAINISRKATASGEILIVTRESRIFDLETNTVLLIEEEDMIVRPIESGSESLNAHNRGFDVQMASASERFTPTQIDLFRYSSLSNNAHRIHYDFPYATGVERYPALVVNGGLTGLILLEAARTRMDRPIQSTNLRWSRPIYIGDAVGIEAAQTEAGWRMRALDPAGQIAVELRAE